MYWPHRGLVLGSVTCFYCSLYFELLTFQKQIQQSKLYHHHLFILTLPRDKLTF